MLILYSTGLILLSLFYSLALLYLRKSFSNSVAGKNANQPKVSVIIAARNEGKNIENCLHSLFQQSYKNLEIIVVNDQSSDATVSIVQNCQRTYLNLELFHSEPDPGFAPKKQAIELGISKAEGELIFTTDADCQPGPEWVSLLVRHFSPEVGMVAGFNPYHIKPSNILVEMLALDYFSMAAVAAATASLGFPISCTGGNLAYRKSVFYELGGFGEARQITSGDDDLFLERVRDETKWKICYVTNPEGQVLTKPPCNLKQFLNQRFRYASKGLKYKPVVVCALFFIFLLNFLLAIGLFAGLFSVQILITFFVALSIKTIAEFIFLKRASDFFSFKIKIVPFILAAILHPIYIVVAVMGGHFFSSSWKGRSSRAANPTAGGEIEKSVATY